MTTQDRITEILRIAQSVGFDRKNWQGLVDALNGQKITTPRGGPWSVQNLQNYRKRHNIALVVQGSAVQDTAQTEAPDDRAAITVQDTVTQTEQQVEGVLHSKTEQDSAIQPEIDFQSVTVQDNGDVQPDVLQGSAGVLQQIPEETIKTLLDMAEWWKQTKGQGMPEKTVETRPNFKRGGVKDDQSTVTFRFSKEMVARAKAQAKKQKALTGGSFNGLVEVLLWRFLGCPEDLVED